MRWVCSLCFSVLRVNAKDKCCQLMTCFFFQNISEEIGWGLNSDSKKMSLNGFQWSAYPKKIFHCHLRNSMLEQFTKVQTRANWTWWLAGKNKTGETSKQAGKQAHDFSLCRERERETERERERERERTNKERILLHCASHAIFLPRHGAIFTWSQKRRSVLYAEIASVNPPSPLSSART